MIRRRPILVEAKNEEEVARKIKERLLNIEVGEGSVELMVLVRGGGDAAIRACEREFLLYRRPEDVVTVSLEMRELTLIPHVVCELVHLHGLYLGGNQLQTVPVQLARLNQLKLLDLSNNQLAELPLVVCELINLEHLYLECNHLKTLPIEIRLLVNLQLLYLHGNHFASIPLRVGKLLHLKECTAYDNPLEEPQRSVASPNSSSNDSKFIEYLKATSSLECIILHGLHLPLSVWGIFLTRGLYDPRLFLYIWHFVA